MVYYRTINHERKFITCFSPKCGSTTLKDWFTRTLSEDERDKPIREHFVSHQDTIDSDYTKYLFLRDPFDRLVSFYVQFVTKQDPNYCFLDDEKNVPLEGVTFAEFIKQLAAYPTPLALQHHLQFQSEGIGLIQFDHVIRVEELDKELLRINQRHRVSDYQPEKLNRTHYKAQDGEPVYDLHPDEIDGDNPPHKSLFWNDELRKLAGAVYYEDLRIYRYAGSAIEQAHYSAANRNRRNANLPKVLLGGRASFISAYSTNSILKPRLFEWTSDPDQADSDCVVYTEFSLIDGCEHEHHGKKKIAWLMESPHIAQPYAYEFIETQTDRVAEGYDLLLTSDRSLAELHPKFRYHPAGSTLSVVPFTEQVIPEKTKLCSMFASEAEKLPGHQLRHRVAKRFQNQLDLFGGAHGSQKLGRHKYYDKEKGLLPYCFSIAMENCVVPLYYTEKITDCLVTGTVPVYWGAEEISEVFDERGIIMMDPDNFDLSELSFDRYNSMLPYIQNNFQIAANLEGSDDLLFKRYVMNA